MRVIAGKYKRRLLATAPGTDVTRPTSDRVKENLFNIISSELIDATVLDLFSGSGALGIEALSRGAQKVFFIEKDRIALRFLQENLTKLQVPEQHYKIVPVSVEQFFATPQGYVPELLGRVENAASINLVIADPPYALSWYDQALQSVENSGLCAENCLFVLEMDHKRPPLAHIDSWQLEDSRAYGKTRLEFWRKKQITC